jgi:hypothetical protein
MSTKTQDNLEKMILQSSLDSLPLMAVYKRLAALPVVSILGLKMKLGTEDMVQAYADELYDLLPGELMTQQPFITLEKDKESTISLNNFPSHIGAFADWPFDSTASGVTVIVGGTGSQKSELIATAIRPEITLRFGEPHEKFDTGPGVLHPVDINHVLSMIVVLAAAKIPTSLDSIRKLAYEIDGAAGSQGVIAKLFTALTDLNNFCSFLKVNVPISINPMVKGEEAIEHVYTNMAGAVSGAIYIDNGIIKDSLIRRKDRRSGIEPGDWIAQQNSSISIAKQEEIDPVRKSLSRKQTDIENSTGTKIKPDHEVDIEPLQPAIVPTNKDLDEGGFDDERNGSDIILLSD